MDWKLRQKRGELAMVMENYKGWQSMREGIIALCPIREEEEEDEEEGLRIKVMRTRVYLKAAAAED